MTAEAMDLEIVKILVEEAKCDVHHKLPDLERWKKTNGQSTEGDGTDTAGSDGLVSQSTSELLGFGSETDADVIKRNRSQLLKYSRTGGKSVSRWKCTNSVVSRWRENATQFG